MICIVSRCTFSPINLLSSHILKSISLHCASTIYDAGVGGAWNPWNPPTNLAGPPILHCQFCRQLSTNKTNAGERARGRKKGEMTHVRGPWCEPRGRSSSCPARGRALVSRVPWHVLCTRNNKFIYSLWIRSHQRSSQTAKHSELFGRPWRRWHWPLETLPDRAFRNEIVSSPCGLADKPKGANHYYECEAEKTCQCQSLRHDFFYIR